MIDFWYCKLILLRPVEELLAEEGSEGDAAADGDAPTKKEKVCKLCYYYKHLLLTPFMVKSD